MGSRGYTRSFAWATCLCLFLGASAFGFDARASAQEPVREAFVFTGEAGVDMPIGAPQSDWFGPGGTIAGGAYRSITPYLLLGARLRLGLLSSGDPPGPGFKDPGLGGLSSLTFAARLRTAGFQPDHGRRGTGLYFEVDLGAALTGTAVCPTFEGAIGYNFELAKLDIGPVARYIHVLQSDAGLDERDAHLVMLGAEFVFADPRPVPVEPTHDVLAPEPTPEVTPDIPDTDHDGIRDPDDHCREEAEDMDQFEDEDGCPEQDNDHDLVLDGADQCPLVAEDRDEWQDEDGCPETDNDDDHILDTVDRCPNEAEVINGVDDQDGCPDEGLIEFRGDRVILEETVLFDFERARVHSTATPVLEAVVRLFRQHPEWTRIRVEGHSDARGDAVFNQELSERRAANVRTELVRIGIPADKIDSVGYGSTHLRDRQTSAVSHQRNRRVEIVVIPQEDAPVAPATP
ncbi:MAG: OmpA family protein [Sandaracinaceae bacterium]|nr:OmpA family protein [Sandaracinaceae bacterium]